MHEISRNKRHVDAQVHLISSETRERGCRVREALFCNETKRRKKKYVKGAATSNPRAENSTFACLYFVSSQEKYRFLLVKKKEYKKGKKEE